jgi:hypothetical protein
MNVIRTRISLITKLHTLLSRCDVLDLPLVIKMRKAGYKSDESRKIFTS